MSSIGSMKILQSYMDAARLTKDSQSFNTVISDEKATSSSKNVFKNELGSMMQGVMKTGGDAENAVAKQIMGVGSVEQTALALNDLNTRLEVVAQAIRISIEKLTELTSRTMGG